MYENNIHIAVLNKNNQSRNEHHEMYISKNRFMTSCDIIKTDTSRTAIRYRGSEARSLVADDA